MSEIKNYIACVNSLQSEDRGGIKMYNIKGHYKWLRSNELYDYWFNNICR